jgi:two-component system phosphate regulon sensor histidine kinase PhoR
MSTRDRDGTADTAASGHPPGPAAGALAATLGVVSLAAATGGPVLAMAAAGLAVALVLWLWRPSGALRRARVEARGASPDRSARVARILAAIPDPVVVTDSALRVIAFNPGAARVFPALARGQPLGYAVRSPDVGAAVQRVVSGEASAEVEITERVPVERAYEVRVEAARDGGTEPDVVVFFRDVTSARRLERMRADFVANASHELRTPLASLSGFIETLEGPAENDANARRRFLGIMREQAGRMSRLIDDLLSLSRIELNEHVAPTARVDLAGLAREVADALSPLARDLSVTIELDIAERLLMVTGDRDELARVFDNLIENAVKYGASGRRVVVSLRRVPAGIEIAVRDFGPGIEARHLPRLTERFYRVDVGDSRSKGGTGLGLAIVKHIVNRHGGKLTIASTPGEGATFSFVLAPAD